MKKVLLLGDSIRLNYMPMVCKNLYGRAEVFGPQDNCRFAKYTLCCLSDWLALCGGTPDIIHWNNGIWDITRFQNNECLTPLEHYVEDLSRILKVLRQTGAKIIFATSTPTREGNPIQFTADIARYNAAATRLMQNSGIQVNDLYSLVLPHIHEYICDDLVHLTKEGIKQVGNEVTGVIEAYL